MDILWEILFGTLLLNPVWSWVSSVSTALMVLFAILAARRLSWAWAVAELSLIVAIIPHLFSGAGLSALTLSPLTLVTLLIPVVGWWNWRRSTAEPESTGIRLQRAGLRTYLIAAAILLAAGLVVWAPYIVGGVLSDIPVAQLPGAALSFLTVGLTVVTLLGFAFGVLESWWLLLIESALFLLYALLGLGRTAEVDALQGLGAPLIMVILHVAIAVFAVRGYRAWRTVFASAPRAPAPYNGLL